MNKPFVFKARIKVADLFHHSHHEEAFTTAMLNKESTEHFAMKLLGICALSYEQHACWSKTEEKLDVWLCDEKGEVNVALTLVYWSLMNSLSSISATPSWYFWQLMRIIGIKNSEYSCSLLRA